MEIKRDSILEKLEEEGYQLVEEDSSTHIKTGLGSFVGFTNQKSPRISVVYDLKNTSRIRDALDLRDFLKTKEIPYREIPPARSAAKTLESEADYMKTLARKMKR